VRLDEPAWWYAPGSSFAETLLRPVGAAWGAVAVRAFERAASYRAKPPVVCVGNFTAGGTGKTPLALLIAAELRRLGHRPAFLTRGYGGRLPGPHWVDAVRDGADDVGDEPLLLAGEAPVLVARDRAAGARAMERGTLPVDIIVMDDGLQNGALAKDLVLAVVDGRRGLGNRRVIPAGPLRAPLEFQLALADAIVVNGAQAYGADGGAVVDWLRQRFPGPVLAATVGPAEPQPWLENAAVVAYAGIGAPERFFDLLTKLGAQVVAKAPFPDHHRFGAADAERLLKLAETASAQLVTTQKDWARLGRSTGALAQLRAASRPLPVAMQLNDRDRGRLIALLQMVIKSGAAQPLPR
jgi:tetraacyldisaccharide 4'-kinase